jgi:hypothetical protein
MTNNEQKAKNLPVAKIRVGSITASIFENAGEKGTTRNVTFERRYRDAQGAWHTATSYNADDLLALAKAADLAHTRVLELQAVAE